MTTPISRRRFITIAGCAATALAAPGSAPARVAPLVGWRGVVLGATSTILLEHPTRATAERLIGTCLAEINRLEAQFSLYDTASTLSRLNRDGSVTEPPLDFYRLLAECRRFHRLSSGAFDPSIQPLWRLFADHFGAGGRIEGPTEAAIERARRAVGFSAVSIAADRVALQRPDMALTLNGIAQGYITDRIADLLRDNGVATTLVSLGETRAVGRPSSGRAWHVGLADPDRPGGTTHTLELMDAAVATSSGSGTTFDRDGRFHHLLDPATGRPAQLCRGVSVVAARATTADALSTALSVLSPSRAREVLVAGGGDRAYLVLPDGAHAEIGPAAS